MTRAYDDLRFLADSKARLLVLEALTQRSHSRGNLQRIASVSPATIGRVLDGLCERGWAVEEDGRWRATPLGEAVAAEFDELLAEIETARDRRKTEER